MCEGLFITFGNHHRLDDSQRRFLFVLCMMSRQYEQA